MTPPAPARPARLTTARLELVAADALIARAACADHPAFARLLGAEVPVEWPPEFMDDAQEHLARDLEADPTLSGWTLWYIVLLSTRTLIGCVGFKGRPTAEGRIDAGYSVLGAYQRRGYATEALNALIDLAFADPRVVRIVSETYPTLLASIGVMEKCGFRFVGAATGFGGEEGVVQYELTRETRPSAVR